MLGETERDQRFDWIGRLVAAGLWILWSVPAVLYPGISGDDVGLAIGMSLVALIAGVAIGALLHAAADRLLPVVTRSVRALLRGLSGATAGFSLSWLLGVAQFPQTAPTWVLVAIPALATPWVLDSIEQVAKVRALVLLRRQELITEAAQLMASTTTQQSIVAEVRRTINSSVDAELTPVREHVARQLHALDDVGPVADPRDWVLSSAAHDSVRPIIDLLSSPQSAQPDPIGFWGTIRAIIRTQPFHPLPLAVIYTIVNMPALVLAGGLARGLVDTSIGVVLIFAILTAGNRIMRTERLPRSAVFVGTFLALQLPTIVFVLANSNRGGEAFVEITSSVVVSFLLVLLTSSLGSWQQRQDTAQRSFEDLLTHERVTALARAQVTADVARQAAHILHGPVQARLAACAVAMEQASRAGDIDLYRESLIEAKTALEAPLFAHADSKDLTIAQSIAHAIDPWAGLVAIEFEIESDVASMTDIHGNAGKVVEEAVTNAVRHGAAKEAIVHVSGNRAQIQIDVHDNGFDISEGSPGLGSRMFDRLSSQSWTLTRSSRLGGRHLSLVLSQP